MKVSYSFRYNDKHSISLQVGDIYLFKSGDKLKIGDHVETFDTPGSYELSMISVNSVSPTPKFRKVRHLRPVKYWD